MHALYNNEEESVITKDVFTKPIELMIIILLGEI